MNSHIENVMPLQQRRGRWHTAHGSEIADPFLMTVVGSSNHWLFVSSTGALTAGRINAEHALFAYETEDRLHRAAGDVGPVTAFRISGVDGETVWCPFDPHPTEGIARTVAKRTLGDGVRFTETHLATGLTWSYEWALSDPFGFVRKCSLSLESGREPMRVEVVDGLRALLPFGVDSRTQQTASVLVDAYKHAELLEGGDIGVFALTARIVDRPEPSEALRCTVAYRYGLDDATVFLDAAEFEAFLRWGRRPTPGTVRLGASGSYLFHSEVVVESPSPVRWIVGTDIGWDAARVVDLQHELSRDGFAERLDASIDENRTELITFVARADGLQTTANLIHDDRHATNAMFNCMRGGVIPAEGLSGDDIRDFIETRNVRVAATHRATLSDLDGHALRRRDLVEIAEATGDPDFARLASEYLPLTFSRRHGDPSRPWNTFNIRIRNADGSRRFYYEGNWRDVFQNWEALLTSFPEYAESAWTIFFNATTADGYNPYRITRDGIDWERPDPEDPWAHIGYWGDHQIIYSLKLLELCEDHYPGLIAERLDDARYVFADVPYRLAPHREIVDDPHETISFDREHDRLVMRRKAALGGDGCLVHDADGNIVRTTLAEKLLISLLAKLGNFVVDGGIWMNTQRPEWNDANNALVGNGLSVVTLAYLVRHVRFLRRLFAQRHGELTLHPPVLTWIEDTVEALQSYPAHDNPAHARRLLLDRLGTAASDYREQVYRAGLGAARPVPAQGVESLLDVSERLLTRTLRGNERADGLFHAYNLLDLRSGAADVSHLDVMLEGQVAVLSSGELDPHDCIALVDRLFDSPLWRDDQNTFLLYPDKTLPRFLDRGIIPDEMVEANPLLAALARDETRTVVVRDADGVHRFDGSFRNVRDLNRAVEELAVEEPDRYGALVQAHRDAALHIWEEVFDHRAFTGRSGSMYGYEGLGSVYWHMVSKLNLAMLECALRAWDGGSARDTVREMATRYYALRAGLGDHKTFGEYGAFPTDAYSHTPPNGGARQPGMTGQVKEDLLTRRGELGIRVRDGRLSFDPILLRRDEFLTDPTTFLAIALHGEVEIELRRDQLAFTVCQVPVVYTLVDGPDVVVSLDRHDVGTQRLKGATLDEEASAAVFERTGRIRRIDVAIGREYLLG